MNEVLTQAAQALIVLSPFVAVIWYMDRSTRRDDRERAINQAIKDGTLIPKGYTKP